MSASTPKNAASPASDDAGEPVYVKLPPPGAAHASRPPQNAQSPLLQAAGTILAVLLCLSLPLAAGAILVLLLVQPSTQKEGLVWLWIVMILFVESIAILCAVGLWRELTGWTGRSDYQR
jgi:hypothetical protein